MLIPDGAPDILHFEISYENWIVKGDRHGPASGPDVLFIHGAGSSDRSRFAGLRRDLQARGVGSVAFDCIGHGASGGTMAQSSLASRTRQAAAVIDSQRLAPPLAIIGFSMGAHNALKLAQSRPVAALILVVPGIFTPEAYDVPFGPDFSDIIRRERSWAASDAWSILEEFTGNLLVIAAENDAVIPAEIPQRLVQSAHKARSRQLLVVQGATHQHLFGLLRERPAELDAAMDMIMACIQGGAALA